MTADSPHPGPKTIFSLLHRVFGDPVMESIFSEASTVQSWMDAEAALARAQAGLGLLDGEVAERIADACQLEVVDMERLWKQTGVVGYPILPLVRMVSERLPEEAQGWMHYGATTQDIMDTGLALQLRAAVKRLVDGVDRLGEQLATLAERHCSTVMAGRTHGQQAVPITFGAKLAVYLRQLIRLRRSLLELSPQVAVVSLYGAAGTTASLGDSGAAVRSRMAEVLGLEPGDGPRHVARDGLVLLAASCAALAAMCNRFARELVNLSRTEIAELSETSTHLRGASSTMPQKANPIDAEAALGLGVAATAQVDALFRAMEADHERAAGEWQVEWHVLPQILVLTAGAVFTLAHTAEKLIVHPERMRANLEAERGRTLAEAYMFRLAPFVGREEAHELVYRAAVVSRERGLELHAALAEVLPDPLPVPHPVQADQYLGESKEQALQAVEDWRRERKRQRREGGTEE